MKTRWPPDFRHPHPPYLVHAPWKTIHGTHDNLDTFHFALHRSPSYGPQQDSHLFPMQFYLAEQRILMSPSFVFRALPESMVQAKKRDRLSCTSDLAPAKPRETSETQRHPTRSGVRCKRQKGPRGQVGNHEVAAPPKTSAGVAQLLGSHGGATQTW